MSGIDLKTAPPERVVEQALPYFENILPRSPSTGGQHSAAIVEGHCLDWRSSPEVCSWLAKIILLLLPSVDRLEDLPDRAAFIFRFDARRAIADPANAEVLRWPDSDAVLSRFTAKILDDEAAGERVLTLERFKAILEEVKAETGAKGKELLYPVRILVTGSTSAPELDRLIPIIEEGSRLPLTVHVMSVRERVLEFHKINSAA
jgi:glutamyl-tRNA synthetase/nondiscriminating glutamyl-tRNA synthetase